MLTTRQWYGACAVLCALSLFAGLVCMGSVPLDSHEIFVAQTTREMSQRGDWVVPYFNGEPRLNKPPLSYWAAGAVAWLAGDLPEVAAWHVRLVSVLAGLGVLVGTLGIGAIVFDRMTAIVAGGLLVSSAGFFSFMHDARPDLLYAMWTTAMLASVAWLVFRAGAPGTTQWGGVAALWIAFAGATLTKGPQLPGLALLGSVLYLWQSRGNWRAVNQTLQPLAGIAIVSAMCLPWWWTLSARLEAVRVEASQLGGALLTPALSRLGDPYYFYRPLQLLLPWLPYALLAVGVLLWHKGTRSRVGFLLYPLLIASLGLSLGRQYRYFYLLPLLGLIVLTIARPVVSVIGQRAVPHWLLNLTLFAQAGLLIACVVWVVQHAGNALPGVLACLLGGGLTAGLGLWRMPFDRSLSRVIALTLLMAFIWPAAALTGALWDRERYGSHRQAALAQRELDPTTPLVTLGVSPTVYVYYSARAVPEVSAVAALEPVLRASQSGTLGLVTRDQHLSAVAALYEIEILDRYRRGDMDDVLLVLRPLRTP